MPANFDPVLSEIFLNFHDYPETMSIDFNTEIARLYNHVPIYFSPAPNVEINTQLREFTGSSQFTIFVAQLETCFVRIAVFINTHNIRVQTKIAALTGDPSGQRHIEVNANNLLRRFLERLKSDYYADGRANLYADGKRYLEMLSILIEQPAINLDDRITQVKALIDEDALEKCADGGYSRLQETVENLEAVTIFDVNKWIKTFLKNQLIESIQKSISSLTDATLTEKIADIMGRPRAGFEIHYHNWMIETLRNALGFSFIKESRDTYVNWISNELDRPENSNKKIKVFDIVEQVKENLIKSITATHLVEFISHRIYQLVKEEEASLESSIRYSELVNSIEAKLAVLGTDEIFSLGEIFDINGEIKSEISFYKTITLRLLNARFFRQPKPFLTEDYQLQIFEKNLQLGLIKELKDGKVSRFVDFIQESGALMQLLGSVAVEKRSGLFNNLIQSTEDFIIFLNSVDPAFLPSVIPLLSGTLDSLGLSITTLESIAHEPSFFLQFKDTFTILEKLDGSLAEPETVKRFFYEQMINPHVFERMLRQYLELRLRSVNSDKYSVMEVRTVLEKLLLMEIQNLNQITFFEPQLASLDLRRAAPYTYLADLNFFQIKLQDLNVEVPVENCEFAETEIRRMHFYKIVSYADFTKAKLEDVHFTALELTTLIKTQFISSKVSEEMINCKAQKAIFDKTTITKAKDVNFSLASLKKTQLERVEECNFSGAKLKDTTLKSVSICKFLGAKLENVFFDEIIDNGSSHKMFISFKYAEFKKVSFSSIKLRQDKIDFTDAKFQESAFESLDLSRAIFKRAKFEKILFKNIYFNAVIFEDIQFNDEVVFDNCQLTGVIFRNCDLSKVDIKENNLLGGAKLERVTLTPYQLINCHSYHIVDYSKVTLVDDLTKTELEVKAFLSRSRLDGAILSTQAVNYLYDKGFCFSGINLQHIDFEATPLTHINLHGATITFTQALQLYVQGRENFSLTTIFIDLNSDADRRMQALRAILQRGRQGVDFLLYLLDKANNDLIEKTLHNEVLIAKAKNGLLDHTLDNDSLASIANLHQKVEAQRQANEQIAKIIFSNFNAEQQQLGLEKITQHAIQRDGLGEVEAAEQLRYLRTAVLTSLSQETLYAQMQLSGDKLSQTRVPTESAVLNELLTEITIAIASRCVDLGRRKKRSQDRCNGLDELITLDEVQAETQAKEIALLVAAERRLFWQKTITPLLNELNRGGEQWFPLLETAKELGNDREAIEFVNVQTHEKQTLELPGKSSLDFLASLHELHNFIPQEKFRENVKNLADNLKISHPLDQAENSNDHFSSDFMLAVALTSKTIINLINNKSCIDKTSPSSLSAETEKAECAINIAGMSVLYLTSALQLIELIGKEFLTQDSLLLSALSTTSKVLGGINIIFLIIQDGFDIAKLVNAKSEGEKAVYATQLAIDGTLTAQTLVSLTTEGLLSAASGALVVPLIGLGVALPSLVQNYETLLQKALETGRFFNSLHEQQKRGGYELVTQTKVKDDTGNEQIVLLDESQRFMKPLDMVGITTIDFSNKLLMLEGPWVYSSMNKGNCYYVDHAKKNAFDFREGVSLSKLLTLSEIQLASKTWLLPFPNFYINYQYQQEPTIIFRHDAELNTIRELQKTEKFISDEYCFPTSYGIYKYEIEYIPTTIKVIADKQIRTFIIPKLDEKLQGLLNYEIDTRGLASGQGIIYLNPGVSIQLYLANYYWVLSGQNLPQDTIEFTQQGFKIGDVKIHCLVQNSSQAIKTPISFVSFLDAGSINDSGSLTYINSQGHGFQLDLAQKQIVLITVNYAALQKISQTLDEFLALQKTDSATLRVVNYSNLKDGYQGLATYVVGKGRLFYTLDIPKHLNDGILIALQTETAFFYDAPSSLLWCTNTTSNRLLHYYVFPGKIYSVHWQGNDLQINVENRVYYKIDLETKKSVLMTIKDVRLLSQVNAINTDNEVTNTEEVVAELQNLIRSTLSDANQTGRMYQTISEKTIAPDINDASVTLQVTDNDSPFIWFRKEGENYQIISMQTSKPDKNLIGYRGYANVKRGYYLGCFLDSNQANMRMLSFFVKENSSDTTGKLYLQTVNSQQVFVSFQNTPPKLIVDFPVKNAVWDKNRLEVLTTEGIYQALDALAHTSIIGFSADWTQSHPDWWQAVAIYLETQNTKQALIAVQGIKDQRGNSVTVYYDPQAKQFIVISQANVGIVYSGKVAEFYFFIKDNCAYQTQGITPKQIEDLFNGLQAKQSLPTLTKIADYYPLRPLGIPTENDLLLMQKLPQFSTTLQDFRILIPHGVELAFDIKDETWRVIAIKAGWFNQQEDPLIAVSELFAHITKIFKLKANQLHMPIPIETTRFCLVENVRFIEIPEGKWPNTQFSYLGQAGQAGYYFYDAYKHEIISLVSSDNVDFEEINYNSVTSRFTVEYATRLNERGMFLEIDPLQVQEKDIPLLADCHQLVLRITANKGDSVMTLSESLLKHYTTIIYQTAGANRIELPSYSWFASKNQNTLIVGNGHSQLVIPYASGMDVPNITIQVNVMQANQSHVFIENMRTIAKNLDAEQKLKHIPILDYGWTKWLSEKVPLIAEAQVSHYQKENLAIEPAAAKLSEQRMAEKTGSASFLSQATAATVSAIATFTLTTAVGLGYAFVRRFRRPVSPVAIKNTLTAVSIPLVSQLPITEARSMSEDKKPGYETEKLGKTTTAKDYQNGFYNSELLEKGFADLSESWSSVASLLAMEFKKRREKRFTHLDLSRKVMLKQIEQMQARHKLQELVNYFIVCIDAKVKKTPHINSTQLVFWIVNHLMNDDYYRKYLNDAVSQSELFKKVEIWLNTFISSERKELVQDQKLLLARALSSLSFSEFISHLFIDKVCKTYRDMTFSEIEELAEKQKLAMLKIIPAILQQEEELVSTLSVSEGTDFIALAENGNMEILELASKPKQQIKQKYLPDIKLIFNYFKPVNATETEKTITSKKAMP